MDPNFRKVALIAASLGLLVSLFLALREDETVRHAATTAAATTQEAPAATTAAEERVVTIRVDVVGGRPTAGIERPRVRLGRDVRLVVTSDVVDHVHVHGYDLFADVAPGAPAEFEFTADTPGRFEIELEDRHVLIADLEVRP